MHFHIDISIGIRYTMVYSYIWRYTSSSWMISTLTLRASIWHPPVSGTERIETPTAWAVRHVGFQGWAPFTKHLLGYSWHHAGNYLFDGWSR